MGLFGQNTNLDAASFKYNPNRQKKQQAQQRPPPQQQQQQQQQQQAQQAQAQSQYLIQSSVLLYFYDTTKNENTSYGKVMLLVRPIQQNGYQLIAGPQQNNPIINFQVTPSVSWTLRDQVYAYLKDPQGRQWTLRFEDADAATKATESMTTVLTSIGGTPPQTQPAQQAQPAQPPQQQQQQPPPQAQPQPVQQPSQQPQQQVEQQQQPQKQPHEHQQLFDNNDDDEDEAIVNTTFVPTIDEEDVLKRLDQLGDLVRSKFDNLVLEAPVTLKPRDLIYEVQNLASQIEDQERQLKEQEQLIDELKQSKQNNRLKTELDIAQTELQSLRSVLKGGKDYRRENDRLKTELKQIKEEELASLQQNLSELKTQLANAHDISQAAAGTKTKELFFSFMGSAIDKLQSLFAGDQILDSKTVTDQIYEVFHQCSEDIFKQIDERGII